MKCEGCGKELNGLVAHIEHLCPETLDPVRRKGVVFRHFDIPVGRVFFDEFKRLDEFRYKK